MSRDIIEELRELREEATQGEWVESSWISQPGSRVSPMVASGGVTVCITHPAPVCPQRECEANARLITSMHRALPALLDVADAARRVAERCEIQGGWQAMRALELALARLEEDT